MQHCPYLLCLGNEKETYSLLILKSEMKIHISLTKMQMDQQGFVQIIEKAYGVFIMFD